MEREAARELRRQGYTLAAIAEQAGVHPTTAGAWCRGIVAPPGRGARDTQRRHREAAEAAREGGRWEALELTADPLWVAGTTMYWGEGSKSAGLRLANTDDSAISLFVEWVRAFHDDDAEFSIHLHLHTGDDEHAALCHWRGIVGHGATAGKTYWKGSGSEARHNQHQHGVCTVRVARSTLMLHRTLGWIDGLSIALSLRRPAA